MPLEPIDPTLTYFSQIEIIDLNWERFAFEIKVTKLRVDINQILRETLGLPSVRLHKNLSYSYHEPPTWCSVWSERHFNDFRIYAADQDIAAVIVLALGRSEFTVTDLSKL